MNDFVGDKESDAGALCRFGGEEEGENLRLNLALMPMPLSSISNTTSLLSG